MLEDALKLAASGIPVFPCAPRAKTPLTERGFHEASTSEEKIRNWWRWQPEANIAIPTGKPGLDVLDVDVRSSGSGMDSLNKLTEAGFLTGAVRVVRTPSGGLHIYFPGSGHGGGSLHKLHLDFKAVGGYVLVPPSYVVTDDYAGDYAEVQAINPPFPEPLDWEACKRFLVPPLAVRKQEYRDDSRGIGSLSSWLQKQPEGNRNRALFWAANRAVEKGGDVFQLEEAAIAAGLGEVEVRKTLQSAMRGR